MNSSKQREDEGAESYADRMDRVKSRIVDFPWGKELEALVEPEDKTMLLAMLTLLTGDVPENSKAVSVLSKISNDRNHYEVTAVFPISCRAAISDIRIMSVREAGPGRIPGPFLVSCEMRGDEPALVVSFRVTTASNKNRYVLHRTEMTVTHVWRPGTGVEFAPTLRTEDYSGSATTDQPVVPTKRKRT